MSHHFNHKEETYSKNTDEIGIEIITKAVILLVVITNRGVCGPNCKNCCIRTLEGHFGR